MIIKNRYLFTLICAFYLVSCTRSAEGIFVSSKNDLDTIFLYKDFTLTRNREGEKSFSKWGYQDDNIYIDNFINYGDMVGYQLDTIAGIFPCYYNFFTNKCYKISINQDDGHYFKRIGDISK